MGSRRTARNCVIKVFLLLLLEILLFSSVSEAIKKIARLQSAAKEKCFIFEEEIFFFCFGNFAISSIASDVSRQISTVRDNSVCVALFPCNLRLKRDKNNNKPAAMIATSSIKRSRDVFVCACKAKWKCFAADLNAEQLIQCFYFDVVAFVVLCI